MIHKPNFFIVGAPRSGTTAMYEYLKAHPEIYMSPYKEAHYFATDLVGKNWASRFRDKESFLKLFEGIKKEKAIGGASVLYLYSKVAAKKIKQFNPNAKIIIMLRSPIEVMYSLFYFNYSRASENTSSFKNALSLEKEREKGKSIPNVPGAIRELYFYRGIAHFSSQVERYIKLFGRDRVKIIIFEDFKKNTPKVYKDVLKFLGVDSDFTTDFKIINPAVGFRSGGLYLLLSRLIIPSRFIDSKLFMQLRKIYKLIEKLNSKKITRPPIDPKLERELRKEFLPEVKKLSGIIGRDVTYWCK